MAKNTAANKNDKSGQTVKSTVDEADLEMLHALAQATKENGFLYLSEENIGKLPKDFREKNDEDKDSNGNIATRLTPEGIAYADAHPLKSDEDEGDEDEGDEDENVEAPSGGFQIDEDVPLPSGGRGVPAVYPFDKLPLRTGNEVPASFHVPATKDRPEPTKSVSSSVAVAIRRYATDVLDDDGKRIIEERDVMYRGKTEKKARVKRKVVRKFIARTVDETDPRGPGCRVFRIEPDANEIIWDEP